MKAVAAVTEAETETGSYKSLAVDLELEGPCCDAAGGHIHASALSTKKMERYDEDVE